MAWLVTAGEAGEAVDEVGGLLTAGTRSTLNLLLLHVQCLAGQELPEMWLGGARSESPARGAGVVYGAYKRSYESVAGGGDGAFVAAPPRCANPRTLVLYRALR